jgi:hypothetical protein
VPTLPPLPAPPDVPADPAAPLLPAPPDVPASPVVPLLPAAPLLPASPVAPADPLAPATPGPAVPAWPWPDPAVPVVPPLPVSPPPEPAPEQAAKANAATEKLTRQIDPNEGWGRRILVGIPARSDRDLFSCPGCRCCRREAYVSARDRDAERAASPLTANRAAVDNGLHDDACLAPGGGGPGAGWM